MDGATLRAEEFVGLVRSIARNMRVPRSIDRDDLIGAGFVALMEELPKFDGRLGVPARAYVGQRLRWRMRDWTRREVVRTPFMQSIHWPLETAGWMSNSPLEDVLQGSIITEEMVMDRIAELPAAEREALLARGESLIDHRGPVAPRRKMSDKIVEPKNEFGRMFLDEAGRRGLTLTQACKDAGIAYGTIYVVLRAKSDPNLKTFRKMVRWMGISADAALEAMER